jgi:hypothetical protein
MNPFRFIALLGALLVTLLSLTSCVTKQTASGAVVYFAGTSAYARKARTLTLSPQQAKVCLIRYLSQANPNDPQVGVARFHSAIVDDCFVFSYPRKADVSLRGYYVDGHTGEVSDRNEGFATLPLKKW